MDQGAEPDRFRSIIDPAPGAKWSREEDDSINQLTDQNVSFADISNTMNERSGVRRTVYSVVDKHRNLHRHDNTDESKQVYIL